MPDAGDTVTATLTVSPHSGSTVATLAVTAPDGSVNAPAASTADTGATWTATVTYTTAGEWCLTWTVSGTGASKQVQRVLVAPLPVTAGTTYATTADLATWLDAAPPADSRRALRRAAQEIDRLLRCAVYDVDDDGLPTDADVIAALRDATCELVSWWQQTGDEHGTASYGGTATIGSVTVGGGSGGSGAAPRVGPQVMTILGNAGLLGHEPLQYW